MLKEAKHLWLLPVRGSLQKRSEIELVHLPTHSPLPYAAWQSVSLAPASSILRFAQNDSYETVASKPSEKRQLNEAK